MKWGQEDFIPTNPDLADILGDTDFDFEIFLAPKFPDFQVPDIANFQKSGLGPAWDRLGPGLGPAWARLGPSLGPAWARLGSSLGSAWAGPLGWPGAFRLGRWCPDASAGRTLRSRPDPFPNAPRDRIRRKEPLLRHLIVI